MCMFLHTETREIPIYNKNCFISKYKYHMKWQPYLYLVAKQWNYFIIAYLDSSVQILQNNKMKETTQV